MTIRDAALENDVLPDYGHLEAWERGRRSFPKLAGTVFCLRENRFTRTHKIEKRHDPGGSGWEIVRERLACPACAKK